MITTRLSFRTPASIIYRTIEHMDTDETLFYGVAPLAGIAKRFFSLMANYSFMTEVIIFTSLPFLTKPSSKNAKFTLLLFFFFVLLQSKLDSIIVFVITQFWFLFTELRNPMFKLNIILFLSLVTAVFLLTTANDTKNKSGSTTRAFHSTTPIPGPK